MKKILSIVVLTILVINLSSCMGKQNEENKKQNNTNIETTKVDVDEKWINDIIEPLLENK